MHSGIPVRRSLVVACAVVTALASTTSLAYAQAASDAPKVKAIPLIAAAADLPGPPPVDTNDDSPAGRSSWPQADRFRRRSAEAIFNWALGFAEEKDGENGESEPRPLVTDRPDFTESSRAVGRGVIQVEMGYLYTHDSSEDRTLNAHSYPELLVRIGMFTDWFELRLAQTFANERLRQKGRVERLNGASDLLVGFRFDLTEQKQWLPEISAVYQMVLPTGSPDLSGDEILPGISLLYSWDVIPDRLALGGSSQVNRAREDVAQIHLVHGLVGLPHTGEPVTSANFYAEFAQSFVVNLSLTERLGMYVEWFAFIPHGAIDTGPAHFIDGGLTYQINDNVQIDVLSGFGLNRSADDFFVGTGLVWRH